MKVNIDLGRKSGEMMSEPMKRDETYYPSFHFGSEEPLDIPHEGEMVIRYRKTSSSMSEDREGEKHYMCDVEVQEIVSVDGKKGAEAPSKRDKTAEESLDRLMEKAKKDSGESY